MCFKTVKKFFVSTEIGLKRFDKCSFKSGEAERSTSSGKDREFGVTVLAGTVRVFQKTWNPKDLLENHPCASQYSDTKFSILARGCTSFHLSALEVTFIKSFPPNLCLHKEFLYRF